MAKRKAAKNKPSVAKTTPESMEPMVIALAEQVGSFLGRVQNKADGWLESEALRRQVSQIRDGATQLLNRVNRAGTAARKSAVKLIPAAKSAARKMNKSVARPASSGKLDPPKRRSEGTVATQGKRQRKPPAEELFDPLLGEPMGKQMGQKNLKPRGRE
jgi:hypothetical protein